MKHPIFGIFKVSENKKSEKVKKEKKKRTRYPDGVMKNLQKNAYILFGHRCVVCGDAVGRKGSTITVFHRIDYDTDNIDVMNIVPLCPHCHATTLKEKDFWKDYILQLPEVKIIHDGIVEFRRKQNVRSRILHS